MRLGENPFSDSAIANLVKTKSDNGILHVLTRESATKEFKETFMWGSIGLYARTMAAFANSRGGYILFGIEDKPRVAVGLTGKSKINFDDLDQAKLTESLNQLFSPEIHWTLGLIELAGGLTLGAIYTFESDDKPLVATKNYQQQNAKILEGDILYRYNSRSQRIKFPELKRLLDDAKLREQRAMMSHIETLVRAGASNAAVLDFSENILKGPNGQTVLIDEGLLDQISFIKEGEFDEVAGAPTLKLVGDLQPATAITLGENRIVRTALSSDDVLGDFLIRQNVGNPEQYIRQAAAGTTGYLPVQFYRVLARLSHDELYAYVAEVATRSPAKKRLLERLSTASDMKVSPPLADSPHPSTVERRRFYDQLVTGGAGEIEIVTASEAQHFLVSIKSLEDEQIHADVGGVLELMKMCFDVYYATDSKVADALRRASCRVDSAMFGSA
ncbi:putative DNA-binding protein [Salinibacterium amurskyense]|uniref:Putative DNA-binding protein n=1 Tax=Salinibacterium amurskyense TaxID=205941 RepID=A0A2M9D8R6_9MICO|nr:ATP-binding protein [Salinibacterium amurskyense]PJJ82060.1 putative DNA-binding protein [Salinibacterium amurskyense]RLQ81842.1 ATP-binding protein [Salinibacterium amurskyense]